MRPSVAVVLALSLVTASAAAAEGGTLRGRVLPSKDVALAAKTVWVGSVPAAVQPDGSFVATGLPAGPTELAIETSAGLFVVPTPVAIAPGTLQSVQLALGGRQDTSPPAAESENKKSKRRGIWANPVTATVIVVGSAIVLGVAVDQLTKSNKGTTVPSPSAPVN